MRSLLFRRKARRIWKCELHFGFNYSSSDSALKRKAKRIDLIVAFYLFCILLQVISGQSVLSAIEQVGSESGSTRVKGKGSMLLDSSMKSSYARLTQ